jgi:hypothetical protein
VLVGAGDLGHAIAHYGGFEEWGFHLVTVYDSNPQKIGRRLGISAAWSIRCGRWASRSALPPCRRLQPRPWWTIWCGVA